MTFPEKTDAFLTLIQANKGLIYKVTNSYCRNSEDRKDLAQEIIIQLWKSFENYNAEYKHSTWIYRIALNTAISHYRKETSRKKIADPSVESFIELADFTPDEEATDLHILQHLVAQLKELERALMLLYLEGKSYKEIAEIFGLTETNVSTKISRIKSLIKKKFTQLKNK